MKDDLYTLHGFEGMKNTSSKRHPPPTSGEAAFLLENCLSIFLAGQLKPRVGGSVAALGHQE